MAWIESHQELGRHPKTKRLARELKISLPTAVGHLFYLWWWVLDYAADGSLEKYSDEDIADAAEWTGDAKELVQALIKSGFIDEEDGRKSVHDFHDYAGKLVERREKDRERKRKSATIPQDFQRNSNGNRTESGGKGTDSIRTEHNTTQQNTTQQNTTEHNHSVAPDGAEVEQSVSPRAESVPYAKIQELYNTTCLRLSRIQTIDGNRKKAVNARFKTYGMPGFEDVFNRVAASEFLNGANERSWKADFDWITKTDNFAKIIEGKYDIRAPQYQPPQQPSFKPSTGGRSFSEYENKD
jgi:polyhydroxyalkanoate synthesis regulator phasin